jgi:5'-nucleotidase
MSGNAMRILLCNDDGITAPGLQQMALKLAIDHEVWVVAPDGNRSGVSNALTLDRPLTVTETGLRQFQVNGTPSDCAHVALTALLPERPDLVVSGINNGANMGDDTLYSGTVAAATEGCQFGLPAMAFSLAKRGWLHLDAAVQLACVFIERWHTESQRSVQLLNINFPALPLQQHLGPKVVRLGRRHASEPVVPALHPSGYTVYWIGPSGAALDGGEGTDFHAVEQGFTAVTPLLIDLTDHMACSGVQEWLR